MSRPGRIGFTALLTASVLAVSVAAAPPVAADPAHAIDAYCAYTRTAVALVFTGVAQVPETHSPLVSLELTCTYRTDEQEYSANTWAPGPVAAMQGSAVLFGDTVTVCESAHAIYDDGHTETLPQRCDAVRSPVPFPTQEVIGPTGSCVSQRQTGRWIVVAEGVGAVRTVPATATTVRCELEDSAGGRPTVQIEESGNAAVAAGVLGGFAFVPLTSRCVFVRTTYLDGVVRTFRGCDV